MSMLNARAVLSSRFDEIIDRRDSNSVKWSCAERFLAADEAACDPLPMWVADSDFRAPQPVLEALNDAVCHGVFGYPGGASKSYLEAVTGWQAKRFGWEVSPDWILQSAGVITSLKLAVQAFSASGDSVLIQPPVYPHFRDDVELNGRHIAAAPLKRIEDGYVYDAAQFEAAIRPNTRLFILSNPHNPTGNVWSEDELRSMGEICLRHNVLVISDEIHQDLIMNPALRHIPFASLDPRFAQNSITCTAPSKSFNLPGLQCANIIVPNSRLRDELARQAERNMTSMVNTLGMVACEAAYAHGEPWLEEMLTYVRANHLHFAARIHQVTDRIRVLPADSLYLAWLDCRGLDMNATALGRFMLTEARVWMNNGQTFGQEGHGYMRINLGCPRAIVDEAVGRITTAVAAL